MGKIVKPLQPKHRETLSPWLKEFVAKVADAPLPKIPQLLADFPTTWPFSRGDLYHWIPLLNRFDSILECFCATYRLADGPQARDFTCEVLLNKGAPVEYCDNRTWTQADLQALGYGQDGDSALIVTILKFSGKLLEHCGNRSVYSSSAHLNDLLNSTSLAVLRATLEVGMELAQRYHASVKRMAHPSRQIGAALLASHYNIDLDRVQQLSQPFVKTPIISFSADPMSTTPASASKGKEKEKAQIPAVKNAASMYANDLVSLATSEPQGEGRWNGWGDIKVVYYPKPGTQPPPPAPAQPAADRGHSTLPTTPTPLRRSSTMGSVQHRSPRVERASGDDASSPVTPHISSFGNEEAAKSPQKTFEIAQSTVLKTPVYELLSRFPDDMPQSARYEVLNRLRVAKALLESTSARQDALAVRLLAIANLSYIHQEVYFLEKVLKQDNDEPRRYQLVYQLAELIHPVQDGRLGVPLWLQTITFQLLEAISHFTSKQSDVLSALNANVNHGILLYVIRKAVAGMREDTEGEGETTGTEADDWRNSLFSLTLHMSVSARLGTEMIGAGIMENLVEILNIRTRVADRNHSMSLAFLDGLIYSYQGAFQSFVDAKGLDRISELTVDIVKKATEMTKAGHGTPPSLRSSVVDYEIPFYQQQTLKWLLKFIHHIMTSWYSFGSNTDRLLRNLVDNSELLGSLSHVIENMSCFGSVVWTNAMIIIGDFINNDPTSFAALMEAGLIKSFLESITGREVKAEHPNERRHSTPQAADDVAADEDAGSAEPDDSVLFEPDDRPHPPARETLEAPRSEPLARGILPSSEAMLVIPTVINSISLNNAGMKMVVSSRVIESYLEIFESAKHVRCLDTDLDHATNIGSSFDELARHHPSLRPAISNAVLDMVARVVHLGKEKAAKQSWGASLSVSNPTGRPLIADISLLDKSGPVEPQGQDTVMATSGPDSHDSGDADQSAKNFTPYVTAVANFLSTYTGNTSLKTTLIHKGGIELLLDMSELPSLPHDFADSKGAKMLQHVVSTLVENCPILGLPSLLRRTQAAVDALQPLVQHKGPQPFFAPFVRPDLSLVTESGEWDQQVIQQIAHGTQAVKALLTTQCLVKTLYNSLPQSNRQAISFPAVNVFDYYARLIETLGPLLRAVLAQEMDIAKIVPSHWPNSTALGEDQPVASVDATTGAAASTALLENQSAAAADPSETRVGARPNEPAAASTSGKSVSPDEAKSVSYKNYEVLRALLHSMMPTSYPFFQGLGKALLPRRERDPWTRSQHLWIAEMLAKTIQAKWESNRELTVKDIHYSVVMLHSVDEMLTDSPRQSDRVSATVIIPVLVAFKENGGFDTLHAMLRQFAEVAAKESDAPPSDSRPRLAKIGMKKILELYLTVVSGKNVWDSVQQVNLAQRPDQRRDTSPIGAQLLVELRMSILPVVRELWESPLIEKADVGVLNRVVNILKAIADVSCEANAYKKTDKQPPALFKREAVPFPWNDHIRTMNPLLDRGEEASLAREAVYRAFGSPEWAEEYIKAHKAGIAGARNPVPPQDTYQEDSPSEPAPSEGQAPVLAGPVIVSGDPMAVDSTPDLDRLIAVSDTLSERPAPSAPTDDAAEVVRRASETREAGGASSSSTRPSQTPSKAPSTPQPPAVTKEDLDVERAKLRKDLIDRCLDVIRAHPTSVYDVADLISITVPLKSDTNEEARQEVGETLANALISFDTEDKASASSIAAYAHLLSILLQDSKPFFRACVDTLKTNVGQYLGFLKTSEESSIPPWIPYILLIFEIVLTEDEQPVEVKWPVPSADAEAMPKLEFVEKEPIVNQEERAELFQAVMEILPRAGVNDMLAIAILRILLILTRDREFAKAAGEKKQLNRIFAMAKQLSGLGSTRFKETKIGIYVMTILRHIVEDDDTLRQIFRFEIRAFFDASQRQSRNLELHTYLRSLSPFAMRSPRVFIEVTEELVKIPKWPSNAEDGQAKQFTVALKDPLASASANESHASKDKDAPKDDSVEPAVQQATQDLNINDVKPTTESGDKEMTDAPKTPGAEAKRPIVENPDGVINFLLDQLLNFQKVDAEPVIVGAPPKDKPKEVASFAAAGVGSSSSSSSALTQPAPVSEQGLDDGKDKKQPKPQFKAEEHPIFIYRCFLLHCLSELLYSYNRAKIEFINFKRGAPLLTNTPVKPRSSVLNYLLNDLLCVNSLQPPSDSLAYKKKVSTADQARMVLVALVAKTSEKPLNRHARRFDPSNEADLNFVRKFVLDTVLRAYREAAGSGESFDVRYGKMQSLAELMHNMIDDKESKEPIRVSPDAPRSQSQIKRLMYEKGYIAALTSSIADVDLTYPGVKRTIKYILRVLRFLTNTAILLSADGVLPPSSTDSVEDEIVSASSLSDLDEEREETPDLYRNSALGMLEPREEDDFSDDESEDDDEEMYDDGYADEVGYDEEMSEDDDENVSDEDEELGEMGHIEGLPGDPAVMEVIMGDQDDEDESMDEDDDDDDDSSEDDDDDEISDALEEVEDHHEVVNENGSPVDDDGASEWESDSDNENDEGEEEIDFEAQVQDLDEVGPLGHFGNINYSEPRFTHDFLGDFPGMDDRYVEEDEADDDEEDEEDEMDEDVFIFDRDNMGDDQPQPSIAPGLGWDSLVIDQPSGAHRHRHGGIRSPFPVAPQAVVIGGPHGDRLSEFRNFFRPRGGPPPNNHDDGINPLLRRQRNGGRDASPRPGMAPTFRFPPSFFSAGHDNPMSLINDLITSIPQSMSGRGGVFPSFQLHISQEGPHGEVHEFHIPVPAGAAPMRDSRNDANRPRDVYHEPQHAVSFMPASTVERWLEEAKILFGPAHHEKALKLFLVVLSKLAPQAIADDKEAKRKEAERKREIEEARRRQEEEEQRKKAEAEAEAKAAREKEEAERKAKEEREAAEAAEAALLQASQSEARSVNTTSDNQASEPQGMEGVETAETAQSGSLAQQGGDNESQERLMTSIRGEQIDITGLGIDPEYLAALPEEFREEVIAQTLTTRRSEARQQAENTGQETEAFNEFLDALPEELRQEIIQQEAQERRRRQREERQRDTNANNNASVPQEMDAASILLTFDATLREEILMDQHEELAEHLPADMVAQARAAAERRSATAASAVYRNREAVPREGQRSDNSRQAAEAAEEVEVKPTRQPVPQMLDKAGVATLLRLMFISQPAAIRTHHFGILSDVCENRQNRLEVISTLLQILQDGSTDMDAVERSFGQLSLKARQPKEKDLQKTPTSLKRSLTGINPSIVIQHNSDVSPLMIVQQCLDLLGELCRNLHIPSLFLTEHEILGSSLKRTLSRKGKGKDLKANKYAINSLLSLLGRSLVMESSAVMQLLADLLNKVTYPLQALERRRREAEEEASKAMSTGPAAHSTGTAGAPTTESRAGQSSSIATDHTEASPMATAGPAPAAEQADADADKSKTEEAKTAEAKKSRQLQPPVIPFHNLTLVVNIFVARECSSKTFQNTISTIKNLSNIPGAKVVFGQELVRQARLLSENIVRDLDDLLPHILKAESGTEIQGVALAKFSPGASEQNKLLRVLTALDHLFDSKAKKTEDESAGKESEKQEFISSLYHNSTFGTMWEKLSACLSAIHQRENMVNVATILLPLIESLMVVCKNTTLSDAPASQSQMSKEMLLSSPPPENRMAGLFFNFTEDHRRVLNELVRNNPKLMSGTFSLLVKNPKVLEFDNKRNYFNRSVHAKSGNQTRPSYAPLQLSVRRDHVFHDSFKSLYFKKGEEMKYGKLNIRFHGEEGVDAGGVTREWFQVLSRQMFDPNYALFIPVSSDRTTFHPNKLSSINDEHLMFFKFIGRIIGKALYEGRVLDCYFSRAVYKRILGKPVSVKDMESFDPEYYKSLVWMLENDITDIITETFAVEEDAFGATETVDLCENGRNIPVTEDNKHDYVRLVVEHKLLASVKDQMAEFLTGFHDIIPAELIAIFNEQELELLISGLPDIDVDDWKSHTEYHNYTPSSQQIQWFWRAVRSFDKEERAKLLQFVTGTSKVPLNGFKELEGMNGVSRFNIHRDYGNKERLPSSHTCFNQLDLPEYESYEILRAQVMKAITAGSDYFGFA